nr:Flp pilus assembly protein CpaB [Motilibacter aurantiacus]
MAPPAPPSVPLTVAARDLPAGTVVAGGDLHTVRVSAASRPSGALDAAGATGRTLASPVRRGEPVTDVRLVGAGLGDAAGPGRVATPVRLADVSTAGLLRVGDRVDVVAASSDAGGDGGRARAVARAAQVLALPDATAPAAGALLAEGGGSGLVVLSTSPVESLALARSAAGGRLSVVLVGQDVPRTP